MRSFTRQRLAAALAIALAAPTAALQAQAQAQAQPPPAQAPPRQQQPSSSQSSPSSAALDEIIVTADFRAARIEELPVSVSVLDAATLRATTEQHFEEAILKIPNLNLSGEGSRARYFQLRGVGELEQYDGAPNPSIGFIVDDIDFSGLGSIGTLFDVDRIEVLRGPQGTRYGANALGGLIYMSSAPPPEALTTEFAATTGNNGTYGFGAALGMPLGDKVGLRGSIQNYDNDGFRDNVFLGRDDTYGRDELTARGKVLWEPSDRVRVAFAGLYVDVDNGYDAWSIDNGYETYSDDPGRDAQKSVAGSARVEATLDRVDVVSITSLADTDAVFSFDADWGNPAYWAPYGYDYVTSNDRERRSVSQELRVLSKPGAIAGGRGEWLAGVYVLDIDESNDHLDVGVYDDDDFCDPCELLNPVRSDYGATNTAVFGQLTLAATDRLGVTVGLRAERRTADYADSAPYRFAPDDSMAGGELALDWRIAERRSAYVRLARGYKAGGFNVSLAGVDFATVDGLTPNEIEFGPEYLTSIETGVRLRSADGRLRADVGAFVARRDDQQVKVPLQLRLGDPSSFLFVTANAERGEHHGIEATLDWQATERLAFAAAVGWLETEIDEFGLFPDIEGREQAHAPSYTYSFGAEYRTPTGWWARLDLSGMDAFFFDYGHEQKSQAYGLANVALGRDWDSWGVKLWARNALDEDYAVRGFYFGNEPPDFPATLYTRLGDPRHYGVTLRYRF